MMKSIEKYFMRRTYNIAKFNVGMLEGAQEE